MPRMLDDVDKSIVTAVADRYTFSLTASYLAVCPDQLNSECFLDIFCGLPREHQYDCLAGNGMHLVSGAL